MVKIKGDLSMFIFYGRNCYDSFYVERKCKKDHPTGQKKVGKTIERGGVAYENHRRNAI